MAKDQTPPATLEEAEKLAQRIGEEELACAGNVRDGLTALAALREEAKTKKIHVALGYKTFAKWQRARRRERVRELYAQGIESNRAIADVLGVTEGTVRNDLNGGAQNYAGRRTPNANKVITAFVDLVTDADQWPTLDLVRLKDVRTRLDGVISHVEKLNAHADSAAA